MLPHLTCLPGEGDCVWLLLVYTAGLTACLLHARQGLVVVPDRGAAHMPAGGRCLDLGRLSQTLASVSQV